MDPGRDAERFLGAKTESAKTTVLVAFLEQWMVRSESARPDLTLDEARAVFKRTLAEANGCVAEQQLSVDELWALAVSALRTAYARPIR